MAITIAAATKAPAIPIAIDVFIRPPKKPGRRRGTKSGYTTERKALFRRGLYVAGNRPDFKTTRIPYRVPSRDSGCRRLAFRCPGRRPIFESGAPLGLSHPSD